MNREHSGFFITLEGGEGAGKSTLIQGLYDSLTARGYQVVFTREPGGCALAEAVRRLLLKRDTGVSIGERAELLLFLAARAQHVEELIRPALRQGRVVICDRFHDSTIAYQGVARGLGAEAVRSMSTEASGGLVPDLTLLLDIAPDEGLQRARGVHKAEAATDGVDRMESEAIEFHHRVRQAYLSIAAQEPHRVVVLDAHQESDCVFADARQAVLERLRSVSV
jgi:dTMP kinase